MNKTFLQCKSGDYIYYLSNDGNFHRWYLIRLRFNKIAFTQEGYKFLLNNNCYRIPSDCENELSSHVIHWTPFSYFTTSLEFVKERLSTVEEDITNILNDIYRYEQEV